METGAFTFVLTPRCASFSATDVFVQRKQILMINSFDFHLKSWVKYWWTSMVLLIIIIGYYNHYFVLFFNKNWRAAVIQSCHCREFRKQFKLSLWRTNLECQESVGDISAAGYKRLNSGIQEYHWQHRLPKQKENFWTCELWWRRGGGWRGEFKKKKKKRWPKERRGGEGKGREG